MADFPDLYNYNWTVDSFDWMFPGAADAPTVADLVLVGDDSLVPGSTNMAIDTVRWTQPIILIHSIHAVDPPALDIIIQELDARGYSFGVLPRPGDSPGTVTAPIT